MLNNDWQGRVDQLLDGDLSEEEHAALAEVLEQNPAAMEWLVDRAWLHAGIRDAMQHKTIAKDWDLSPKQPSRQRPRLLTRQHILFAAATTILLLLFAGIFRESRPDTFASMEQTRAAMWKSGNLPTADGSRLGRGTLVLAEGLATLKFDSGAMVTLEAPAELILVDAMNCELNRGTAVSDIPDSAHGFRILTPHANVIDRGTRFAISVHETTGQTHTQVIEGKVEVESRETNQVVELRTGQHNTVEGSSPGDASEEPLTETRTLPSESPEYGAGWIFIETVKDAYTGRVEGHESDVLLYLKKGGPERIAFLGFNLRGIAPEDIEEAELLMWFAPTGWGLASHVPDSIFGVYGLTGEVPAWDESILRGQFPGTPDLVPLGSFDISQGVQRGRFSIQTEPLKRFLREGAGTGVTLKVVRKTKESDDGGLVHGFASRRHPVLPGPTLAIRVAGAPTRESRESD